jgi:hypothetical protein
VVAPGIGLSTIQDVRAAVVNLHYLSL